MHEPIVIDLASHYKGHLTAKIETLKQAILDNRVIEFDYFYDKGEGFRRIEPYIVVFQWTSWYVFGFCHDRLDWRMFKLNRLWNLSTSNEHFSKRDIPPEKRDFNSHLIDKYKLKAVFDKSVKYLLIETYGPDCYHETDDGLYFEIGYDNKSYMSSWLLSFGDKVKILEPKSMADEIKSIAKNILSSYL